MRELVYLSKRKLWSIGLAGLAGRRSGVSPAASVCLHNSAIVFPGVAGRHSAAQASDDQAGT